MLINIVQYKFVMLSIMEQNGNAYLFNIVMLLSREEYY